MALEAEEEQSPRTREMLRVYSPEELDEIPQIVKASSCSCGNPVALASLRPGQVVVDLGSGAGMDVFLAARRVAPGGKAIGIDATPEMIWKARRTAEELRIENAEFRLGEIEYMPVKSESVDVVISNCVINLSPSKGRVFREAFRILRPGGKLAVSDRVLIEELPDEIRDDRELWASCVSGALPEEEYLSLIREAGFIGVKVEDRRTYTREEAESFVKSVMQEKESKGETIDPDLVLRAYLAVANLRVVAFRPG